MPEWQAEITVDEALVRRLLALHAPELAASSVSLLGTGWDNAVWLVDGRWAFRFPRRRIAIPGVEREIASLPLLAPLLPAPVPVPVFVGAPSGAFPWPFFGAELLPGREPERGTPPERARGALAAELGCFLRALHDPELVKAVDPGRVLPVDLNGRADMALRVPKTREWLAAVAELGSWRAPPGIERLLSEALELGPPRATAIVHGDLHFRHVLVDDGGRLAGVIDWGDLCRADPSVDLALVWALLPRGSRDAFLEAYGPVPADRLLRARVLALCLCGALAAYGRHEALPGVEREALDGLRRAAEG